ncbi:MAG: phosphate ABC transporter ATP-binding protein [Oscillospiraceae bacterium]|nr:phosphate ABC transporter ATP-binding protein [Oscillospiraceae bacterium]
MKQGNTKISIRDYQFFYGEKQALFDINLDIRANEILSVLGPANSGITTLLRSLNRLCDLIPKVRMQGDILVDGESIYAPHVVVTELRRRLGMVFDVPSPLPMTIFDNIAFGPRLHGKKNRQRLADTVEQSLRMAALWEDVKDRLHMPAMSLSGGQQQRLCIARVLALQPEVILLDRPCSGLDPISTSKIEDSLQLLKKRFTIVIAPHNVQQATRISDSAAFMLMGRLIEVGVGDDLFANPRDKRTSDYITGRYG